MMVVILPTLEVPLLMGWLNIFSATADSAGLFNPSMYPWSPVPRSDAKTLSGRAFATVATPGGWPGTGWSAAHSTAAVLMTMAETIKIIVNLFMPYLLIFGDATTIRKIST
jgi:hypothetical protein